MTSSKESFINGANIILDQLSKTDSDALVLFQSKEFVTQCPCSGTSVLLRCLFDEDVRGMIIVFHAKQRQVDVGIIPAQFYDAYKDFSGTFDGEKNLEIRVMRIQKAQGGEALATLRQIFQRLVDNKITSVGHFAEEESFLKQTKVMQEAMAFFQDNNITLKALTKEFIAQVISMPAPEAWEREFKDSARQALKSYQQVAQSLERHKYVSSAVKAQFITKAMGVDGLGEISKSANAEFYYQDRDRLRGYKSFQAILNCSDETLVRKALNSARIGHSSVIKTSGSLPIDVINMNIEVQDHISARIGRAIVSVSDRAALSATNAALDYITRVHQEAADKIQVGLSPENIQSQLNSFYAQNAREGDAPASGAGTRHWAVKFLKDVSGARFSGLVTSGVCTPNNVSETELPGLFGVGDSGVVLLKNHLIQIRTVAEVTVGSIIFIVSIEDAMLPLDESNRRPITSPYHTRTSPFPAIRDYFYVNDKCQPSREAEHDQKVKTEEDKFKAGNDEESTSQEDRRGSTMNRRERQQKLQKKLPDLEEAVYQRQIARQQHQKLLCDSKQNTGAPTCFDSVGEMPKNLDFTDKGVVLGNPLFFIINGRPVPILPQYIHNATTVDQDSGIQQIKIKFIAPGNVQGKKEQHPQLDQYQLATFLKELVLETSSASFAAKILKELKLYKKQGDEIVAKQTTSGYFAPPPDPDGIFPKEIHNLINKQPQVSKAALRPTYSIDNRAMNAPIMSKPRLRSLKQSNKRDQGELHVCQQGILYKYTASGANPVSIMINYQNIKNVYFEKFTNKQHVLVLSFRLYKAKKLSELMVGQHDRSEASDRQVYSLISFYVSMESETRLGAGADRDDVRAEQAKKEDMRRGNEAFSRFLHGFTDAAKNWFTNYIAGSAEKLHLSPEDLKVASENHKQYFCKVVQHNKEIRFQASAEGQGLQQLYSYQNGAIGCFNKRVATVIELDDIDLVVFENVSYASRGAFQMAFVFKDVRVETQILKQIRFDDLQELQLYLLSRNVFYAEHHDSIQWAQLRTMLNKDRETYENFANMGGWLSILGIRGVESTEEESSPPTASSEASYQAYSSEEPDYSDESSEEDVKSVSGHDSEEDDYVYDWDRSDD